MCSCHRRGFIGAATGALGALAVFGAASAAQTDGKPKVYTCPPCGCPNDGKEFSAPGRCSVCEMPLMEKPPATTPEDKPKEAPKAAPSPAPAQPAPKGG